MAFSTPSIGADVPGPSSLGILRLEEVVGAGAFGTVFRATSSSDGRPVAVKFLHGGAVADAHIRRALENEATLAATIAHPNVLRVLHSNLTDPDYPPYLVSEFANGGRLHDRINAAAAAGCQLSLELVRDWSLAVVGAMEAVNTRLLHRDLKPDNILFHDDVVKVADFGLAKVVGAATRSVTFKGGQHVLYMAPEAWAGERNEIQVDMYAAGILLFQVATLNFPFDLPSARAGFDDFRRMHLLQPCREPRSVRADLPQKYSEVLQRMMAKRPEARHASWADIYAAVDDAFRERHTHTAGVELERILREANRLHQKNADAQQRAVQQAKQAAEEAEIDGVQRGQVVNLLSSLVTQFNAMTQGKQAALSQIGVDRFELRLPYASAATLSFFPVTPPIVVASRTVRYACRLADAAGCGFNLLLSRGERDIYGEWLVCRVSISPQATRIHSPCAHFGFDAKDVAEIEQGLQGLHVYVPELSDDLAGSLSQFVQALYSAH